MFPSFSLFGKTIYMYAVMAVIGLLVAGFYACRTAKKRGHDDNVMIMFLLMIGIGIVAGSSLMYALTNIGYVISLLRNGLFVIGSFKDFWEILTFLFGGMVFYGGLIGGFIAALIYAKVKKLDFAAYSDMTAPAVPLFHTFGRVGCFLGGCCYGVESDFGFTYTHSPAAAANNVNRFPIQLVEAVFNLVLFFILSEMQKRNKLQARLFPLYLILYATGRFILEFWRGDVIRGFILGLSTSQFISIILLVLATVFMVIKSGSINARLRGELQ